MLNKQHFKIVNFTRQIKTIFKIVILVYFFKLFFKFV